MGIGVKILLGIIVFHFIAGFGFLFYKLMPREEYKQETEEDLIE